MPLIGKNVFKTIGVGLMSVFILGAKPVWTRAAAADWAVASKPFTNETSAQEVKTALKSYKFESSIALIERNGTQFFRVSIGPLGSESQAQSVLAGLNDLGFSGFRVEQIPAEAGTPDSGVEQIPAEAGTPDSGVEQIPAEAGTPDSGVEHNPAEAGTPDSGPEQTASGPEPSTNNVNISEFTSSGSKSSGTVENKSGRAEIPYEKDQNNQSVAVQPTGGGLMPQAPGSGSLLDLKPAEIEAKKPPEPSPEPKAAESNTQARNPAENNPQSPPIEQSEVAETTGSISPPAPEHQAQPAPVMEPKVTITPVAPNSGAESVGVPQSVPSAENEASGGSVGSASEQKTQSAEALNDRQVLRRLHDVAANLRSKGYPVFVHASSEDTRELILVGEFKAPELAADMESELEGYGYETMVSNAGGSGNPSYQVFVNQSLVPDSVIAEAPPDVGSLGEPGFAAATGAGSSIESYPGETQGIEAAPGTSTSSRKLVIQAAISADFKLASAAARMLNNSGIEARILEMKFQDMMIYPVIVETPDDRGMMRSLVDKLITQGFEPKVVAMAMFDGAVEKSSSPDSDKQSQINTKPEKPPPDENKPGGSGPLDLFL